MRRPCCCVCQCFLVCRLCLVLCGVACALTPRRCQCSPFSPQRAQRCRVCVLALRLLRCPFPSGAAGREGFRLCSARREPLLHQSENAHARTRRHAHTQTREARVLQKQRLQAGSAQCWCNQCQVLRCAQSSTPRASTVRERAADIGRSVSTRPAATSSPRAMHPNDRQGHEKQNTICASNAIC